MTIKIKDIKASKAEIKNLKKWINTSDADSYCPFAAELDWFKRCRLCHELFPKIPKSDKFLHGLEAHPCDYYGKDYQIVFDRVKELIEAND